MRAQTLPLATATCIARLIVLHAVFNKLAWTLYRSEDDYLFPPITTIVLSPFNRTWF
jgi:hypothetical protein